jgi:hypothetical protein
MNIKNSKQEYSPPLTEPFCVSTHCPGGSACTNLLNTRYSSDVHLHRSQLYKSWKHGNSGFRSPKEKKEDSELKECILLETVICSHDFILRVEITDVKLIRTCLESFWWGEAVLMNG